MGSVSAMRSIDRVLDKHSGDIEQDLLREADSALVEGVHLINEVYSIEVVWWLSDGTRLRGPSLSIDQLANDYPDCEVAY